jgi:uncharacterized protein (TIGR03435 family)
MKRAKVLSALLLLAACGKPSSKKGGAPELKLDSVLQAPAPKLASLADLKGKVAVLEFWATWCDPCVEQIPHLNSLIDKFAGKPIVFISISDEPRAKVEAFLKEHPMKGWVAVEAKDAFASYGVRGRPSTFLIGKDGALAGKTYPAFLGEEELEAVLAGKPLPHNGGMDEPSAALDSPSGAAALFEARIASAAGSAFSFESSEEFFKGRALNAEALLAQAYGVNDTRVKLEPPISMRFDVDMQMPHGQGDKLAATFQNAALAALSVRFNKEKRSTEATALLKAPGGARLKTAEAKNGKRGFSTGPGRITASGMSVSQLADALEQWAGRPVIDETGLKGRFDFELTWDIHKQGSLEEALESQLGIKAVKAARSVELLIFKGEGRK